MLLHAIRNSPADSLRYMERFVNDGSISGFSKRYTTSEATSPFGDTQGFHLYLARASSDRFITRGVIPSWPAAPFADDNAWIFVHPDMISHHELEDLDISLIKQDRLKVLPTASGRTVQFANARADDYVKLHYIGILGRVDRRLPFKAAISGPEASAILQVASDQGILHDSLAFLPEPGGRVLETGSPVREWGMTWRGCTPYGPRASRIAYLIPMFSLFSSDLYAPQDMPLLCQLIDIAGVQASDFVVETLLIPMVRGYFATIRDLGLQPEWNAQNVLLATDHDFGVTAFVMRDLESVDKDVTLRTRLGLPCSFESAPRKCIQDSQYNYRIKHSFMFDYKFCGYIIEPILKFIASQYTLSYESLVARVHEVVDDCLRDLPNDFFPEDGCWYGFAPVLIDQSQAWRPYVKHPIPVFRTARN
jgi:siderophore synthetase component